MSSRNFLAEKLVEDIMSYEDVDSIFYSLYVHDKAYNPFSIIHFEDENHPTKASLFSLEQYDGKNIFHLISQTSVNSDIRILLDEYPEDKLLAKERNFKRIEWFRQFAQKFKSQFKEKVFYDIVESRMDGLRILMNDDGEFTINLQYSIYSEHTAAVSCYIDFDSDFNLISVDFGDSKLSGLLAKLEDKQLGFEFLLNRHISAKVFETLKELINIEQELNNDTLKQYVEIIKMVEI